MTGSIGPSESYFVRLASGKVLGPLFREDVLWLRRAEAIGTHTPVLAPGEGDWAPLGDILEGPGEVKISRSPSPLFPPL